MRKGGEKFRFHAIGSLQFLVRLSQLALRLFGSGEIACDFRCADDDILSIANRRNGERNIDAPAIFALPLGFEVIDPLAFLEPR